MTDACLDAAETPQGFGDNAVPQKGQSDTGTIEIDAKDAPFNSMRYIERVY